MARPTPRIVILGGGFAGLAAAVYLCARRGGAEVWLVDRSPWFTDVTQLHRSVALDITALRLPLQGLAKRHGFRFIEAPLRFTDKSLTHWQKVRRIPVGGGKLPFDFLLIATGAGPRRPRAGGSVLSLRELRQHGAAAPVAERVAATRPGEAIATIAGAGPSGLQFLFELDDHLRASGARRTIHVVTDGDRFLSAFPPQFHDYVADKLASREDTIRLHPHRRWIAQRGGVAAAESTRNGARLQFRSPLTLLLGGLIPTPLELECNAFGQVLVQGSPLPSIFAAGDCARYPAPGLDSLTAQAAVRKGRLVAENILRLAAGMRPLAYDYRELGYFLSLGSLDGIGWLLSRASVLKGTPALAVKQAIEAQFQLLLRGVDTYLV